MGKILGILSALSPIGAIFGFLNRVWDFFRKSPDSKAQKAKKDYDKDLDDAVEDAINRDK